MRIILVRHGTTAWNEQGKYQGVIDEHLSDKGRQEAERAAERLQSENIKAVYASYLSRARETAEIIARPHGLEVVVIPEVGEIDFGHWEGLTARQIIDKFGEDTYRVWMEDPENAVIAGGERMTDFSDRVYGGFTRVVEAHPEDTVVMVTHGGALMALCCRLENQDLSCYRRYIHQNAAISVVELEGTSIKLKELNSKEHLLNIGQ